MNAINNQDDFGLKAKIMVIMTKDGRERTVGDLARDLQATPKAIASACRSLLTLGALKSEVVVATTVYRARESKADKPRPVLNEDYWLAHMPGAGQRAPAHWYADRDYASAFGQALDWTDREESVLAQLSEAPTLISEIKVPGMKREVVYRALNRLLQQRRVRKTREYSPTGSTTAWRLAEAQQ